MAGGGGGCVDGVALGSRFSKSRSRRADGWLGWWSAFLWDVVSETCTHQPCPECALPSTLPLKRTGVKIDRGGERGICLLSAHAFFRLVLLAKRPRKAGSRVFLLPSLKKQPTSQSQYSKRSRTPFKYTKIMEMDVVPHCSCPTIVYGIGAQDPVVIVVSQPAVCPIAAAFFVSHAHDLYTTHFKSKAPLNNLLACLHVRSVG